MVLFLRTLFRKAVLFLRVLFRKAVHVLGYFLGSWFKFHRAVLFQRTLFKEELFLGRLSRKTVAICAFPLECILGGIVDILWLYLCDLMCLL